MTMKTVRKTKLKNMKRKQRIEKRIIKSYSRTERGKQFYETVPVVKSFDFDKQTQDWNPDFPHTLDDKIEPRYHIPRKIQNICEYLKDLFCIDHKILLDIRYRKNNNTGVCYHEMSEDGYQRIVVGAWNGLRATTLIHEFLHAAGFDHQYEINGYSDYRSTCTLDTYTPLIVKDIFGRKEVLLN